MEDIRGYLERANLLLSQGRPKDAETWIKKALETDPDNAEALSLLARSHMDRKEFDKGIELLKKAISISPGESHYFYLLGFAYYQKENPAQALQYIQQAISMYPYHPEYFGLMAYIYLGERNFKKALEKANEGLEIDPENITCLNARATAQNKLKQTDEAIETMQDALAKDPDNEFTHTTVGWNYLEKGKHREATQHFKEALRISPGFINAQMGLKESLKSKIPPYRWLLQFGFWMQNKGKNFRWIFLIGLFLAVRATTSISSKYKETENLGLIVGVAYFLFVASTWILNPLANSFLFFHRDGKHALTQREKWNAIGFMSAVMAGIVLIIFFSLSNIPAYQASGLPAALIVLSLCIPLGYMEWPVKLKGSGLSQWMSVALVVLGLSAMIATLAMLPVAESVFTIYLVLFVIYTWVTAFS